MEEAAAYEELITKFGRTQEDVAQEVGKSRSHVANTIRLLKLPEQVQGLDAGRQADGRPCPNPVGRARSGSPGAGTDRRRPDGAPGRTAFGSQEASPVENAAKDPNIADLEASISNALGLKVQIIHNGDKGGDNARSKSPTPAWSSWTSSSRRLSKLQR